ncbi:MAG: hypothetical protein K9G62_03225 [Alphaproteobacteria bacterium]|nr:hypothetical protein [Alphaproteobacteria bacterium]
MTDRYERNRQDYSAPPACRVAYTINNAQPVACTIIGDQPLFYMDYEGESDDDFSEDISDAAIKREIQRLEREVAQLDRLSSQSQEEKSREIHKNGELFGQIIPCTEVDSSVESLMATLTQSRLGDAYLHYAQTTGIRIETAPHVQNACSDLQNRKILLNPHESFEDRILLLARELRRHWRHDRGGHGEPLSFYPDHAILLNRVNAADLAVSMIRIGWELQLTGLKSVWERLEISPLSDLAHAFSCEAFSDFRTLNNGKAASAVLEAWFLSERCKKEDKKLIQTMLADYKGYISRLGGEERKITPPIICALGEAPFGKNYLSPHVETILNDPVFSEVRDRSNANFLWFIKFERSFGEVERQLQTESLSSPDSDRSSGHQQKTQDRTHAIPPNGAQAADILQFSRERTQPPSRSSSSKQGSADIIYLRRWSGE